MLSKEELIAFEADIAAEFNAGKIRAPVHLHGGNEDQLIEVFKEFKEGDWVCSTWRSHYHCLLAGVPPEKLKAAIMKGRSITLTFPEHRVITSAIVGGILPIALGIAWSIKKRGGTERVWCFVGDMSRRTGIYYECLTYVQNFRLPIIFVCEDNLKSVCTPTVEAWGGEDTREANPNERYFSYRLPFPHSGAGKRIQF